MSIDLLFSESSSIRYYNLRAKTYGDDINFIFNDWDGAREKIAILSPHDNDAILGASYIMLAAALNGAVNYIFIMCDGRAGYTNSALKDKIVEIRKRETIEAYGNMDIAPEQIIRFNYPDFSLGARSEWLYPSNYEGIFTKILKKFRELEITRLLVPNGYCEHSDHTAAYDIGRFAGPQAGGPIFPDLAAPSFIKSYIVYSVWGDFSPEDALVTSSGRIRANMAIKVPSTMETLIQDSIRRFRSQRELIDDLIDYRGGRICKDGSIEVYQEFDPRPVLDYVPYMKLVDEIDNS